MPLPDWFGYQVRFEVSKPFIKGRGIEIGAGASPQRLPDGASCCYFDKRNPGELGKLFLQDIAYDVMPMSEIPVRFPGGADFLIAHQVVEHSPNPIRTLLEFNCHLRDGGVAIISVPDKQHLIYDRDRPTAPFSHVLLDFLLDRDDHCLESKEHMFSFCLGWSHVWEHLSKSEFIDHLISETRRDGHDFHWHALDRAGWDKVLGAAAVFGSTGIRLERIVEVDSPPPWNTQGEIIYIYRVDRRNCAVIGLGGVRDDLLTMREQLSQAVAQIDRQLPSCTVGDGGGDPQACVEEPSLTFVAGSQS
jgi:SAM-dependent methyltransferase